MTPFIGQIALLPYNFAPIRWAFCQGQILPISQYTALFSLLGTSYGGNGRSTFALPDLRGRTPNGQGQGPGLQPYVIGEQGGEEAVTLAVAMVPTHTHGFSAFAATATAGSPAGALPAEGHSGGRGASLTISRYAASGTATTLQSAAVTPAPGANQPHDNMQPYLALNWCIALEGEFPARS